MPGVTDMVGKRFGGWLVLARQGSDRRAALWLCQCDRGRKQAITGALLRSGDSKRCKSCSARKRFKKHGQSFTRLYRIWADMKSRCNNTRLATYRFYGGRGISVCKEWQDSFESFRDWALSSNYKSDLKLDRTDNSKGYSPGNCRWATSKQQSRNTRTNAMITINGVTRCRSEWAEISGVNYGTIKWRQGHGIQGEMLIEIPTPKRARA
jgi:hypothetical protein